MNALLGVRWTVIASPKAVWVRKGAVFNLGDVLVIQDDGTARLNLSEADAAHLAALSEVEIKERIVRGKDDALDDVLQTIKIKAHRSWMLSISSARACACSLTS